MEVWIQKHDYETDVIEETASEHCLALLGSFDWTGELEKYEEALEAKRDRCPPGMGFVDGDRVLHVMPIHEGRSHYHYSCDHPSRLFALFGACRKLDAWAINDEHRATLLQMHYDGKQEELLERLAELSLHPRDF